MSALDPYDALPKPKTLPLRWALVHHERPYTANESRRWHWARRAKADAAWRQTFCWLAKAAAVPHLEACRIEVTHYVARRGNWPDSAACAPCAKAGIDGLVDAGVIDDDDPTHLVETVYRVAAMPDAWRKPGVTGALGVVVEEVR